MKHALAPDEPAFEAEEVCWPAGDLKSRSFGPFGSTSASKVMYWPIKKFRTLPVVPACFPVTVRT